MKESLTNQTIRGFFWLATGKGSKAILQLGVLTILARLLTPTEFGLIGIALIVVSFSDIFTDLGFGPAITQKKTLSENDIQTGFTFSIIFGFVLVAMIWFLAPYFSLFFQTSELTKILRAISLVLLFKAVSSVARALIYRNLKYKEIAVIELVSFSIGYGLVGIILAYTGFGVWSLVLAVLGQTFIESILILIKSKHSKALAFNINSLKDLSLFGGGYSLGKIFSYIGNKGDKIIVGRFLGADSLGLYERAYQLVKFIASLAGEIIDKVLFAPIAKKQTERQKLGKIFIDLTYIISFFLFPLSAHIFINAQEVVLIILGDQWLEAQIPIQIMAVSLFFLVSGRIGSTLAKAVGDVYSRALRNFIFAALIILGSILAVPWDINGVTLAVLFAFIVNYILACTQTKKLTNISYLKFINSHFIGLSLSIVYISISLVTTIHMRGGGINSFVIITLNTLILILIYFSVYIILPLKTINKYKEKVINTYT